MEPRYLLPGLLVCALSCAAFAAEQTNPNSSQQNPGTENGPATGTETGPETLEHVEAVGYPVPEVAADEEEEADKLLAAEQFREKIRQEIRREPNRRALMNSVRDQQIQLLETFRIAGEGRASEELAQEAPTERSDTELQALEQPEPAPKEELEPAALTIDVDVDQEEEATAIEPVQEKQVKEEPLQEPT